MVLVVVSTSRLMVVLSEVLPNLFVFVSHYQEHPHGGSFKKVGKHHIKDEEDGICPYTEEDSTM